jgi:alpha-beta hydrolase superfamily lysophospholipase
MKTGHVRLPEFKECQESFYFTGPRQWKLHARFWEHETTNRKGTVIGVHGYSEHSDRYAHFAGFLNRQGYDAAFLIYPGMD